MRAAELKQADLVTEGTVVERAVEVDKAIVVDTSRGLVGVSLRWPQRLKPGATHAGPATLDEHATASMRL